MPVCGVCGGPTKPSADGFICPNGHITPLTDAVDATAGGATDTLDAQGGWTPSKEATMESHVQTILTVLEPDDALEGAVSGAGIEGEVDEALEQAWGAFSAFAQSNPLAAAALVEQYKVTDGDAYDQENSMDDEQIEARALQIAESRLEEALGVATGTMRQEFERQLKAQEAEYNRKLREAHIGYERRLEQKDQRFLAGKLIEEARFKAPTEAALKADFHDAYFESERDADGAIVRPGEDRLRVAVAQAIKDKRVELSAYVEARFSGAGESDVSLREAGVNPGGRAKAPLDSEIDSIIGIGPKE